MVRYSRLVSVECEGLSLQKAQDRTRKCPMPLWMSSCAFHRDDELAETENHRGSLGRGDSLEKSEQWIALHPDDEQQERVVVTVEVRFRSTLSRCVLVFGISL